MTVTNGARLEAGVRLCEALGVDPNEVTSLTLKIGPMGELEAVVTMVPTLEQLNDLTDIAAQLIRSVTFIATEELTEET